MLLLLAAASQLGARLTLVLCSSHHVWRQYQQPLPQSEADIPLDDALVNSPTSSMAYRCARAGFCLLLLAFIITTCLAVNVFSIVVDIDEFEPGLSAAAGTQAVMVTNSTAGGIQVTVMGVWASPEPIIRAVRCKQGRGRAYPSVLGGVVTLMISLWRLVSAYCDRIPRKVLPPPGVMRGARMHSRSLLVTEVGFGAIEMFASAFMVSYVLHELRNWEMKIWIFLVVQLGDICALVFVHVHKAICARRQPEHRRHGGRTAAWTIAAAAMVQSVWILAERLTQPVWAVLLALFALRLGNVRNILLENIGECPTLVDSEPSPIARQEARPTTSLVVRDKVPALVHLGAQHEPNRLGICSAWLALLSGPYRRTAACCRAVSSFATAAVLLGSGMDVESPPGCALGAMSLMSLFYIVSGAIVVWFLQRLLRMKVRWVAFFVTALFPLLLLFLTFELSKFQTNLQHDSWKIWLGLALSVVATILSLWLIKTRFEQNRRYQPAHYAHAFSNVGLGAAFPMTVMFQECLEPSLPRCSYIVGANGNETVHVFPELPPQVKNRRIYFVVAMYHETNEEMIVSLASMGRLTHWNVEGEHPITVMLAMDDAFTNKNDMRVLNDHSRRLVDNIRRVFGTEFVDRMLRSGGLGRHGDMFVMRNTTCYGVVCEASITTHGARFTGNQEVKLKVLFKDTQIIHQRKRSSLVCAHAHIIADAKRANVDPKHVFVVTLDGDTGVQPQDCLKLVSHLVIRPAMAAVCGRIIPRGEGLLKSVQEASYFLSHAFTKSTERVRVTTPVMTDVGGCRISCNCTTSSPLLSLLSACGALYSASVRFYAHQERFLAID